MLETGDAQLLTYEVTEVDLASRLALDDGDAFPEVLATSRLAALMELAAARLMRPLLGPGELSVGVAIDIKHSAPTPVGATVEVRATYLGPDGKLHRFTIEASDPGGPIGQAVHTRAIVDPQRLLDRAHQRGT